MIEAPKGDPSPSSASKIKLLKNLRIFHSIEPKELDIIAEHSELLSFKKGDPIIDGRGKTGRLYAVLDGEVVITRKDEHMKEISLATFDRGKSFGEFSLFERKPVDTAARCEEDAVVLAFPGESIAEDAEDFFSDRPDLGAKILYNLLAMVADRIRTTNRLIAEKTPWVQALRRKAMVDKLTGLYNKSYLEEDFTRLIDDKPAAASLLMMKPDNFKTFNDTYGHDTGDRVLQLMASGVHTVVKENGIPIRFKGDVYAIVLPDTAGSDAIETAVELQRAMLEIDLSVITSDTENTNRDASSHAGRTGRNKDLRITVCIGIASYSGAGLRAADLVDRAYENLFKARGYGNSRIHSDEHES
jgi:diguanylate cyclase (GGDEF)-like protein